jgi:V/A-type H+-transporting ATPase subunit E
MALDEVINNIVMSAQAKAEEMIQVAEGERANILHQVDEKVSAKKLAQDKELELAIGRLKQQEISSAELEAKRTILNTKKEIMDRSFEATLDSLRNMDESGRKRMYQKILDSGKAVISSPKVYCPMGDARLIDGMTGLGKVEETEMEAGLILEDVTGRVRLDYRFRTLLASVWDKELKNVSAILFG